MKHLFTLLASGLLLHATSGLGQTVYQTVGIIGSATPPGWNSSSPMNLTTPGDLHNWSLVLPLVQGEVKFRANNQWLVNWGNSQFPVGTGVDGGPNIPIPTAGNYLVRFNDITGDYQFGPATLPTATTAPRRTLQLTLAPNPATGETLRVAYTLPAAGAATVSVHNMLGQLVRQGTPVAQAGGPQQQQVALRGLTCGWYLVRLQTGATTQTARLLVE